MAEEKTVNDKKRLAEDETAPQGTPGAHGNEGDSDPLVTGVSHSRKTAGEIAPSEDVQDD